MYLKFGVCFSFPRYSTIIQMYNLKLLIYSWDLKKWTFVCFKYELNNDFSCPHSQWRMSYNNLHITVFQHHHYIHVQNVPPGECWRQHQNRLLTVFLILMKNYSNWKLSVTMWVLIKHCWNQSAHNRSYYVTYSVAHGESCLQLMKNCTFLVLYLLHIYSF